MDPYKQGQNDAGKGLGPANNPNWSATEREKYNAGYSNNKK